MKTMGDGLFQEGRLSVLTYVEELKDKPVERPVDLVGG
jgi:hypothetical protein